MRWWCCCAALHDRGRGMQGSLAAQVAPTPTAPPPAPSNNSNGAQQSAGQSDSAAKCCHGCYALIQDRFYLLVMDKPWHVHCLRCCECKSALDSQQSCFAKDGLIYCKDDYFKCVIMGWAQTFPFFGVCETFKCVLNAKWFHNQSQISCETLHQQI